MAKVHQFPLKQNIELLIQSELNGVYVWNICGLVLF